MLKLVSYSTVGDIMVESLKNKIVIPLDLAAQNFCVEHSLPIELPPILYDQNQYQKVFGRATDTLMDAMYDSSFFEDWPYKPNPIFVGIYQYVALFAGNILKILELSYIISTYSGNEYVLIEENKLESTYLPVSNYCDVAKVIYSKSISLDLKISRDDGQPEKSKGKHTKNMKDFFILLNNSMSDFLPGKNKNIHILSSIQGAKDIYKSLIFSGKGVPKIERVGIELGSLKHDCSYLSGYMDRLSKAFYDNIDLPCDLMLFSKLNYKIYLNYKNVLEYPLYLLKNTKLKKNKSRKILISRCSVKPSFRVYLYNKYLSGFDIYTQECSDGLGTGVVDASVLAYRSPPISKYMIYNGEAGLEHLTAVKNKYPTLKSEGISIGNNDKHILKSKNTSHCNVIHYLPTAFSGHLRIGTNRELNDLVSWDVQKRILSILVSEGFSVVYKAHPKPLHEKIYKFQINWMIERGIAIETRPLNKVIDDIEFVVSDHLGSGVQECLLYGIPSIIINLNSRNLYENAKTKLESCFYYIDGNPLASEWELELQRVLKKIAVGEIITNSNKYAKYAFGEYREVYDNREVINKIRHELNND